VDGQPDLTPLVRSLHVAAAGDVLGRAFQGRAAVRGITDPDAALLAAYSRPLPLEPRARLLPEERLEALLYSGDEAAVTRLMEDEPSGLAAERRAYLLGQATPTRDRRLAAELRDIYAGSCQLCGWSPRESYRADLCEAHHVRWLSRGGADELANLVLVCPNHHRAIHRLDAPFDYGAGGFLFGAQTERLLFSRHELAA
jgi:hypothetical protein